MSFNTASVAETAATQPARAAQPVLTVAICTRNRAKFLRHTVDAVLAQLADDAEMLIIDNASSDDTPGIAATAAKHPRVRAIHEKTCGLSVARNRALDEAQGKYVIFLDDDAIPEPGWLEAYRRFFFRWPSPRLAAAGGAVFPDFEHAPPRWLSRCREKSTYDLGAEPKRILEHRGPWGCNIAYVRDAAIRVGRFNPELGRIGTFLGAHEELDLNLRLERAGGEIWWVPGAAVRHFVGAERLNLKWHLRGEFAQSRSRALMKLQSMPSLAQRLSYSVSRLVAAPFHCGFHVAVALVSFPWQRGRVSALSLIQAARVAGKTREAVAGLFTMHRDRPQA
jgi:glycosyltransferase involved in cell wall biosynthesis